MHKFFKGDVSKLPERRYDDKGKMFECDVFAGGGAAPLKVLATEGERTTAEYHEAVTVGTQHAEPRKTPAATTKPTPPNNKKLPPPTENK